MQRSPGDSNEQPRLRNEPRLGLGTEGEAAWYIREPTAGRLVVPEGGWGLGAVECLRWEREPARPHTLLHSHADHRGDAGEVVETETCDEGDGVISLVLGKDYTSSGSEGGLWRGHLLEDRYAKPDAGWHGQLYNVWAQCKMDTWAACLKGRASVIKGTGR